MNLISVDSSGQAGPADSPATSSYSSQLPVIVAPAQPRASKTSVTPRSAPVMSAHPIAAPVKPIPVAADPRNRRIAKRKQVRINGQIATGTSHWLACTVHDMSATGALLEIRPQRDRHRSLDQQLPERFYLVVETLLERSVMDCWVKWKKGDRAGVQFMGPIDVTVKKMPPRPVRKPVARKR